MSGRASNRMPGSSWMVPSGSFNCEGGKYGAMTQSCKRPRLNATVFATRQLSCSGSAVTTLGLPPYQGCRQKSETGCHCCRCGGPPPDRSGPLTRIRRILHMPAGQLSGRFWKSESGTARCGHELRISVVGLGDVLEGEAVARRHQGRCIASIVHALDDQAVDLRPIDVLIRNTGEVAV